MISSFSLMHMGSRVTPNAVELRVGSKRVLLACHFGQLVGAAFQPRWSRQECRSYRSVEPAEVMTTLSQEH